MQSHLLIHLVLGFPKDHLRRWPTPRLRMHPQPMHLPIHKPTSLHFQSRIMLTSSSSPSNLCSSSSIKPNAKPSCKTLPVETPSFITERFSSLTASKRPTNSYVLSRQSVQNSQTRSKPSYFPRWRICHHHLLVAVNSWHLSFLSMMR